MREVPLALDLDGLRTLLLDNDDYARALTSMIFAPPALMHGWRKALFELQHITPIRLRFAYSPEADDLHAIRWELLQDPLSRLPEPLALSGRFLCSRYLEGSRYDPLPHDPLHELSALIIVASPRGLERYGLTPLNSQYEVELVRQALPGVAITELRTGLGDQPVTLEAIREALRSGHRLVYLLAHGRRPDIDSKLYLEDDAGDIDLVPISDIVHAFRCARPSPLLIVLASCFSAGDDDGGTRVALGSQLVRAGIPATVAMQGSISQPMLQAFLPDFFRQLRRHGQVDQALVAARIAVRRQADEWWKPVLFLGLHSGRLWSNGALTALGTSVRVIHAGAAGVSADAQEVLRSITPGQLLQISSGLLRIDSVSTARRDGPLITRTLRGWDPTLARHVLVQAFEVEPDIPDGPQAIEKIREHVRLHEAAVHWCPRLPRTYAVREDGVLLWAVREWIDGSPLMALYPPDRQLPSVTTIAEMIQLCLVVCEAVIALYDGGLPYVPVSPSMIIYQRRRPGTTGRGIVLLDFPTAHGSAQPAASEDVLAPEQLRLPVSPALLGQATTIYQIAATLYRLVTHRRPDLPDQGPAPFAHVAHPAAPAALGVVLDRALAPRPSDRYQRVVDLVEPLRRIERELRGS